MSVSDRRRVVITGIGLVSALGEGVEPHLAALAAGEPGPSAVEPMSGYPVHPAVALEWDRQIPKKSDQRQMEAWQKLGCYAAGLALDSAGAKEDVALKAGMQLVVAAGGGERDFTVDGQILTGMREAAEPGAYLNEHLLSDLRPTLFLAQLSNLAAGNISIVHGVTGASRTFMGEEAAGIEALRIAEARIAAGQADIMLAGGSYNAERPDGPLIYELGGYAWRDGFAPVNARTSGNEGRGGLILGSAGAFLVLESEDHATARGAKALARIEPVVALRARREPGSVSRTLGEAWPKLGAARPDRVLSGASGVAPATGEEHEALAMLAPGTLVTDVGDFVGHPMEATAPIAVALAAALVAAGSAKDVVVTSIGHRRGEGLVRVTAPV